MELNPSVFMNFVATYFFMIWGGISLVIFITGLFIFRIKDKTYEVFEDDMVATFVISIFWPGVLCVVLISLIFLGVSKIFKGIWIVSGGKR